MSAEEIRMPPPQSIDELCVRAEALRGRMVCEVAQCLHASIPTDPRRSKGFIGQLVERILGADPTAGVRPDFTALGIELKTIPVNAQGMPKESTFCCSIDLNMADTEKWETSRLRTRLARVLWVPMESAVLAPMPARRFGAPVLWSPSMEQEACLRSDWEWLMGAIGAGYGGVLNAREGEVLQVRPKAANRLARTIAPAQDGAMQTLPLGFYLRAVFTEKILRGGL
jgi:DNA mismatch repair protein MutH